MQKNKIKLFVLYFLETNHAGKAYKLAYNKSEFMPYNYVNIYANAKLKRKNISEERLIKYFGTTQNEIYAEWKKAKKKSDMADALCMCIDF